MRMAKVLLIVAQEGFQTKEYHDPKRVLESAGHTVATASVEKKEATSNVGEKVAVDVALRDVKVSDYDAIFAVGGPGALTSLDNEETARVFRDALEEGAMPYGAICIAPRILAKAGVLNAKRATGWDADKKLADIFTSHGVHYVPEAVVIDGRVVTADGPSSAEVFGKAILKIL